MKLLPLLIFLYFPCASLAQSYECPEESVLDQFLEFGDLYIGELHGTNETPKFFKCLLDKFIVAAEEPIIVSLELDEYARDSESPFWNNESNFEDGRSSNAIYELVQYLIGLEEQNIISIHFQLGLGGRPLPSTTGDKLRELSEKGQVIALSGNIHSMKFLPQNFQANIDTEGMFVGPNFTHISIGSALGGEIWACMPNCGINSIRPSPNSNAAPGALIDGSESGHDYIYYLDIKGFTASIPMSND